MGLFKKAVTTAVFTAAVTLLFPFYGAGEEAEAPYGRVASSYILKLNGETLWAKNTERRLPPASLTKIMTGLIALKKAEVDDVVTVGRRAARETGTRIGLKEGDRVYMGYLLAAALTHSANDACHAVAEHVGGSEAAFVKMMNDEAKAMGLKNTNFQNACGHDNRRHYSTAGDLALLAEEALKDESFSWIVSLVRSEIKTVDGGKKFWIENKNELIGRYPGAVGVKTGFTRRAGKCLVAQIERDEGKVLLVMLNAPNRWWGAVDMLDAAYRAATQQARYRTGLE